MCQQWILCLFYFCFGVFSVTDAFNIDFVNYASYQSVNTSMFGFSVAVHKEGNNGWVLVGAPEAQSTTQRGVFRGGVVFKCPTDRDGNCQEIPFDIKGDNFDSNGQQVDNKTEQWFGATVSASGRENGPIVACAPRYTWYPRRKTRRDPVGTCYVSDGLFHEFTEYSPCRTYQWGYHRQGSCQAGFSAAINSVGDRLFIGSPGSWYWQGQMYSIDAHATFEFKPLLFSATYGHEGQVHQQSLEQRPAVFSTVAGGEKDDDSYMGYSTIVGDFLGNGEEGIAVGMPRGNSLRGKVLLFTWNLTNFVHHFASDQIGSYYGYALAASDVDGDGKLDLIIGAPMYTVQNNKDKYDVGRVYVVYHQSDKGRFVNTFIIDGFNSRSRFGQALASLNDINQDGYGDFAVGAPYDGEDNGGAVYIYLGSSKGVRKEYSQVIFAEDLTPGPTGALTTFGFSITGGLDLDNNEYPDMAVGAYLSGKAFFFRSRPVIQVEAYVKFLTPNKEVDITKPNYELRTRNNTKAVKTQIQFCSRYYGKGISESLTLGIEYILDSKKLIEPRMGFVDLENENRKNATVTLYKGRQIKCLDPIDVYVKCDIRDKLTSLVAEVTYHIKDTKQVEQLRDPRSILTPVLDLHALPSQQDSIMIHKNCTNNNVCIPNLSVSVTPNVGKYLLNSGEKLFLDVFVINTGEDAFESTLEVKYPNTLYYKGVKDSKEKVSRILCTSTQNDTAIKCDIGNPIPNDKVVNFQLLWEPNYDKETSEYVFQVSVNSTNQEKPGTRGDNNINVTVETFTNFNQTITGYSHPSEVFFSSTSSLYTADISNQTRLTAKERLSEEVIGPQVTHVFHLKNEGKTTIRDTEIFFIWPATTLSGEDFFYLLDPPHFSMKQGLNIQCGPIPANYRGFKLLKSDKTIWERLNINVQEEVEASQQVGSQKGGQIVDGNENIDKQVAQSGDSSSVIKDRKNTTFTPMTIQVFEGTFDQAKNLGWTNSQFKIVDGRSYIYRCFKDGQEASCGDLYTILGDNNFKSFTSIKGSGCLQLNKNGRLQLQECGILTLPPITGTYQENQTHAQIVSGNKGDITIQILQGGDEVAQQLGSRSYKHHIIDGQSFIYRCFRKVNNLEREEIDCGDDVSLSGTNIDWLIRKLGLKQSGSIKYQCLEPGSNGNLQLGDCTRLPQIPTWSSTKTIQFFQANGNTDQQIRNYRRTRIDNQDLYYRCFNDQQKEVDCGEILALNNAGSLLQKLSFVQDGTSSYQCLVTDSLGNFKQGDCWALPKIATSKTTVQFFRVDEHILRQFAGKNYRRQLINNQEYICRCFKNNVEVDCEGNFSFDTSNLAWLLRQLHQEGNLQYQCLETDGNGDLQAGNCENLPKVPMGTPQKSKVSIQFFLANKETVQELRNFHYQRQRINNQDFIYRCFNERRVEIDCKGNVNFEGNNIDWLLRQLYQEGNLRYQCLESDTNGRLHAGNCQGLPKPYVPLPATLPPPQKSKISIQFFLANNAAKNLATQNYQREMINNQEFFYRCFKHVNGREEPVDCSTNIYLEKNSLAWLLQQLRHEGNLQYQCLETDSSGSLVKGNCGKLPEQISTTSSNIRIQLFLADDDAVKHLSNLNYRKQRINNQEFIYRCFTRVDGHEEEIDCGNNISFGGSNLAWLLQQLNLHHDGNLRYQCLERDSSGNLQQGSCANLPKIETTQWSYNSTHFRNASGIFLIGENQAVDVFTIQVFVGGEATARQLGSGNYRLERVSGQEYVYRCFDRYSKMIQCGTTFSLAGAGITWMLQRVAFQRESSLQFACFQQNSQNQKWGNVNCAQLPTVEKLPTGSSGTTGGVTTHVNIMRRCHKLVDNAWKPVDCGSKDFQVGGKENFAEQCYLNSNGTRKLIPCDQAKSYLTPTSYNYDQDQYGVYGEYDGDDNTNDYSSQNYGQNLGLGNVAQGNGFTAAVLDLGEAGSNGGRGGAYQQSTQTHWSKTRQLPTPYNDIGRDNVPTEYPTIRRGKRQVLDNHPSIAEIQQNHTCKAVGCIYMRCTVQNLEHDKLLYIALRGRVNARALKSMGLADSLTFSSMMLTRVNTLVHSNIVRDNLQEFELKTVVKKTEGELKTDIVPLWVVVLSAVAGTIILLLVVFLLYKCGFFKRNRPSSAPERQPLNRNGYHHGDEAL